MHLCRFRGLFAVCPDHPGPIPGFRIAAAQLPAARELRRIRAAANRGSGGQSWRTRLIWAKTDAGRAEMQARSLVKERPQRNLLLVIDGKLSAERLLADVAGITQDDFARLASLGLIAPVTPPAPPPAPAAAERPVRSAGPSIDVDLNNFDYATLRAAIGRQISELGIRGFGLSMILEESTTVADLKDVAERLLKMIADRKGLAAADKVSKKLFG